MMKYYVGLGSNLGARLKNLQAAKRALKNLGSVVGQSSVYESQPWGKANQPVFLNAVLILKSPLRPFRLLRKLKRLEMELGRYRTERWGARIIDLDLLQWEGAAVYSTILQLPHPYLEARSFVLKPLYEVAPRFVLPSGKKIEQINWEQIDKEIILFTETW